MKNAYHNPILNAIPEGETITVYTANGLMHTGTDDTSADEVAKGLFVLYARADNADLEGCKANRKTYLSAASVVGFDVEYDV